MALPFMIFSGSNNQRKNTNLTLFPRLLNGGETFNGLGSEPVFSNYYSGINHVSRNLSLLPPFNGGNSELPVMTSPVFPSYVNTSLSLVIPSFNVGVSPNTSVPFHPRFNLGAGESMRRSGHFARNYHSYSSPNVERSREILRARLLSALSTRRSTMFNNHRASSSSSTHHYPHPQILPQRRAARVTITELDNNNNNNNVQALAPTPLRVYYPSPEANNEHNNIAMSDDIDVHVDGDGDDDINERGDAENGDGDDGVTHSLPYRKYGPYTCPRCFGKFSTSQIFAAHVSSHYKYETKAQRKRRLMARIKRKNLHIHRSREGLTLLPTRRFAQNEGPMNMDGADADGGGVLSNNVRVKQEPAAF